MAQFLPRVMGHRGAAAHAPENTLAGIRMAARLGAPWVEFDVMLTGDGVPVLYHDDSLKRLAGIDAVMAETPWSEVAKLDVGSSFSPDFAGEGVPSLEQGIAAVLDAGLHPNIEFKPTPGRDVETAVAAIEVLSNCWPADRPPPFFSAFSRMSLAAARALRPDWPRALIAFTAPSDWASTLRALGCVAFHLGEKHLTFEFVAEVKEAGYEVASFTVNNAGRAAEFADWPVDCLISDVPDQVLPLFDV